MSSQGTNIARGAIAVQSSTYSFGRPENAIDGKRLSNWNQRSSSQTLTESHPWWRLDLRMTYKVYYVTITNRKDCCADRLNGARIHIGNSLDKNGNDNPM